MNVLLQWWAKATPEDKRVLAQKAGTSVGSIHQMAHSYRSDGKLNLTPEMARRIELALDGQIKREQMCQACGRCEYAPGAHCE